MKILFTGASGFLGRYAAPRLASVHETVGTYHEEDAPLNGVRLVSLNLEDPAGTRAVVERERPDLIIHAAALSRPDPCDRDPEKAQRINVEGTRTLAEMADRMIFISSDLVFDGTKAPYRESDPVSPTSVYAGSKVDAECAVLENCEASLVLRLSLGYGWKPFGPPMFCDEMFRRIRSGDEITLFADQFRTTLYMKDAAEILIRLSDKDRWPAGRERLFHCGGPESVSRAAFGRLFCEALKLDDTKIRERTMAQSGVDRPADCSLNSSRLYEFTGFRPRPPREGLADMALEIP